MTTKSTKRALIVSVLSLFICFTMLLGTTYAWFTDSVTSAGNIIKTGTLDVSLEYSKTAPADKDDSKWIDASTGAIFDYNNWEPGYVQVRYVKIENEGSLALKFILNIIPNVETAVGEANLADVIEVYMIDGAVATVDRAALTVDNDAYVGTLASLMAEDDGAAHGELVKGEFEIYTIVLKMSESAGNEYQDKSVGGGFTVQLLATQLASENDDLGTNDYDTDATYPAVAKVKIPAGTTVPTPIKAGKTTVKIPAGVDAGEYEVSVSNENLETDENDNVTASFDIEVTKDGEKVGNGDYVVEKFIGKNLNLTEVTHKGEVVNGAVYDPATGIVTFTVNSFSPFAITYYSGVIENVEDLANIAKGGNFVLAADIELAERIEIPKNVAVALNLNGHNLSTTGTNAIYNQGDLVITGKGKISSVSNYAIRVQCGSMLIDSNEVEISSDFGAISVFNGAEVTINGGNYFNRGYQDNTSHTIYLGGYGTININGGTFDSGYSNGGIDTICGYGWSNDAGEKAIININGGTFYPSELNGSYFFISNYDGSWTEINISGGTFNKYDPAKIGGIKIAEGFMSVAAGSSYMVVPNTYVKVADGLYRDPENAVKYYVFTAAGLEAINGMMADKTAGRDTVVEIMADIDFAGKTWVTVDSHADTAFEIAEINGNGHTIYNLTINGQAMFSRFAGSGDVVIKDITFDGAVVNSTILNTSILTGQTYQNVLLDNVDVKNSSITGAYKVAPLIATVYNESATTITATLKNCDVSDTTVTSTSFDFFTCGLVSFVYTTNNDCVEYENCSITNVALKAVSGGYNYHANIHYTADDTDDQINEHPGVVVTNVTFERIG